MYIVVKEEITETSVKKKLVITVWRTLQMLLAEVLSMVTIAYFEDFWTYYVRKSYCLTVTLTVKITFIFFVFLLQFCNLGSSFFQTRLYIHIVNIFISALFLVCLKLELYL